MKKYYFLALCLLVTVSLAITACGDIEESSSEGEKLQVYTSIYPVYYITSTVAGEHAEVTQMVPAATDPHKWEPTPRQVADLNSADIFIYNGFGLEAWAESVAASISHNDIEILELASLLEESAVKEGHEGCDHEHLDPHFWLDPLITKEMAQEVKELLVQAHPEKKAAFNENYETLQTELDQLHEEYKNTLEKCEKRKIVVTHQAFGYLAERYHLEQIPIMGISPESEPSSARLAELTKLLRKEDINYVFTEPLLSDRSAGILAEETGAEVLQLNPIGSLTKQQVEEEKDYMSLMKENLNQLKVALECNER